MGSPQQPTAKQYAQLEKSGRLTALEPVKNVTVKNAGATLRIKLPRQGVSLLKLTW
jgi:xylan 1,4-beta-xylosidase